MSLIRNRNYRSGTPEAALALIEATSLAEVERFHSIMPGYTPTPLHRLSALAAHWGVGEILVKDESPRFGLNAFKVLGAGYAVAKILARRLGRPLNELSFSNLQDPAVRHRLPGLEFAATTDGNHGRGVAWMAAQLGFKATIFMPKGTVSARLENIRKLGQSAQITTMNYDDTVRWVAAQATEHHWEVVQDTGWEGYEEVPRWIMQGYSTVVREALAQLGDTRPTHVLLQAGVGAFAAVVAALLVDHFGSQAPRIILMEAREADCFFQSYRTGERTNVTGDLATIMAGLACGEPNPLSWEILRECGDSAVAVPDEVAALGMRVLGNPLAGDPRIVSGESGAVGIGVLGAVLTRPTYASLGKELGITKDSRILCFSTEGDTDPDTYRRVTWEGAHHE